ncbi:CBO0543 family protein [Salipaludibacillus sp. CF4.18]|uniref:CBO0543 family protein n=1 Tax=Salipaludibacillus sp. CF4.18 TaxID=3373081 RepID=UPI003EE805E7
MKDKTILHVITVISMGGLAFLFRKGPVKDWFLIYLLKSLLCTFLDVPVNKKKFVKYPIRYFPKSFDSNIVFLYVIFPLLCVLYNQFTYKMKAVKTIPSVFLYSTPMVLVEKWLEKNTKLVTYSKGWNSYFTLSYLTFAFWLVRLIIDGIRALDRKRNTSHNSGAVK